MRILLAFLATVVLGGTSASIPQTTPPSSLDARKKALLIKADQRYELQGETPAYPTPNYKLKPEWKEEYYIEKALAIFGLINLGATPETRIEEANRVLRWAFLGKWPCTSQSQMIDSYGLWDHRARALGIRLYALYANWLDPDIKADWEQRLVWQCVEPFTGSSENIRTNRTTSYFLAHELTGNTDLPSYQACKDWLVGHLKKLGKYGYGEWGSPGYHSWTIGAILNLAEFAQDPDVKKLATMLIDYTLAQLSGFLQDQAFCSGSVRRYGHGIWGAVESQALIAGTMFTGVLSSSFLPVWVEWGATNYRPLSSVAAMYVNPPQGETRLSTGSSKIWRYKCWRGSQFAIATHNGTGPNDSDFVDSSGGTHDILGCYVQSSKKPENMIAASGYDPDGSGAKKRDKTERYFGYKNVGFAHHGGITQHVWAGGSQSGVPIRLFYAAGFAREFQGGWAFLSDGVTYAAWRPTIGSPQDDFGPTWPDASTGKWLRSSHVPGAEGEVGILEAGDAAMFGSYAAFKSDVLARNPLPTWNGKVSYQAKDGAQIEFGADYVKVNGQLWNPNTHPRASMPGLADYKITQGGANILFNFDNNTVTGATPRLSTNVEFGAPEPLFGPHAVPGRFQAEDYTDFFDTTAGNSGGEYRTDDVDIQVCAEGGYNVGWIATGEWLAYDVEVARTGTYGVIARVASGVGGAKKFHIEVDGVNQTGTVSFTAAPGWQSFFGVIVPNLRLTAGPHEIRLVVESGGFNLNWLEAHQYDPVPGRVEAEDYKIGGEGVGYHDTSDGNYGGAYREDDVDLQACSEGGHNVGWIGTGEWLAYFVYVSQAASFDVIARVATAQANRSFHLEIDGTNVSGTLTFGPTGGWQTWANVTAPNVSLAPGFHTLKVVAETGGWNLNYIDFDPVPASIPGIVEAENYRVGGPGVGYIDTTPGNSGGRYRDDDVDLAHTNEGFVVGWTAAGEKLGYRVVVQQSGTYAVTVRVASPTTATKQLHLEIAGTNVSGPITFGNTGGWGTFQDVTVSGVSLTAGSHLLVVVIDTPGFNWNRLKFVLSSGGGG